jgi:uncharacterized protein
MIEDIKDLKKQIGLKKATHLSGNIGTETDDGYINVYVDADLELTNTGRCILVTGIVKGQTDSVCVRCLNNFKLNVECKINEHFYQTEEIADKSIRPAKDEDYFLYKGTKIDLTEALRQNILMAIPLKTICKPDCKGLCSSCGCDRNIQKCSCEESD